jgi:hypothetical protein
MSTNITDYGGPGQWKVRNLDAAVAGSKIQFTLQDRMETAMHTDTFLQSFEPAIESLAKNDPKLAVSIGASNTQILVEVYHKLAQDGRNDFKVTWVEGDDVTAPVSRPDCRGVAI